jgi:NADH-quinone oxidoreductase subunit C
MGSPAPLVRAREGIVDAVKAAIGEAFLSAREAVDEVSIDVARESIAEVLTKLRDELDYQQLMEIAGVDYPERAERFEVVYHLLSVTKNHRLRVRVSTDEDNAVPTVTGVYPVAGWLEREVFDMFGVAFEGHSDLRRILTDYGFDGHPFRKDFPLSGHVELRYSEEEKRVVYEPVRLAQDFRNFDFLSPWEGAQYAMPGDEKASPEAPGAPTPLKADEIGKSAPAPSIPAAGTPKTTDSKDDTGAGEPANREGAKTTAQKPGAGDAEPPKPAAAAASEAPETRRMGKPRGGEEHL